MKTTVAKWHMRDLAQKHLVGPAATLQHLGYHVCLSLGFQASQLLLRAHRYAPSEQRSADIKELLATSHGVSSDLIPDDVSFRAACDRTVILRRPRHVMDRFEPGVLLIKFTETNRFFFHHVDRSSLLEQFCVVLEPSWAGYALPEILCWGGLGRPVVVQSSDSGDRAFLRSLDFGLVPVSLGSSDWVDHRIFRPLDPPLKKEFDAIYVANYRPAKRIHVFLRTLRRVLSLDPDFRAALVCSSWGGRREAINDLLDHYALKHRVPLFEDLDQPNLNEVLNRSRCNVLLSLKEGSNRSLFEAMFANVPVILLDENVGVNRAHIVSATGKIVPEKDLCAALLEMKTASPGFSPRSWALKNISPERSTAKLGAELDKHFPGSPTRFRNLVVKVNSPEARYYERDLVPLQNRVSERVLRTFLRNSSQRIEPPNPYDWSDLQVLDNHSIDR